MPISPGHVGRRYPPTRPYQVTRSKITEFARALGDANPAYSGDHPVAPPTLAAAVIAEAWQGLFDDAELEVSLHRIVHAEQKFSWTRPLRAGDEVVATLSIEQVRVRGANEFITVAVALTGASPAAAADDDTATVPWCVATSTFVHSRELAA